VLVLRRNCPLDDGVPPETAQICEGCWLKLTIKYLFGTSSEECLMKKVSWWTALHRKVPRACVGTLRSRGSTGAF